MTQYCIFVLCFFVRASLVHGRRLVSDRRILSQADKSFLENLSAGRDINDDACPPDGKLCCEIGHRWQTMDFLRQSLGMGVEQCLQVNLDLAQVFAGVGAYVPIQLVFAAQGVYDFGIGAGSSGALAHQVAAERRKLTATTSAAVQITIIPKNLYVYVTLSFQTQVYQRELDTHPHILSTKEVISLLARSLLGEKYLSMRFSGGKQKQDEFVGTLLDMYTFTGGLPSNSEFLDRFGTLVDSASTSMNWPETIKKVDLDRKSPTALRTLIYQKAEELHTNYLRNFWNLTSSAPLSDCYNFYAAFLDRAYAGDILSGLHAGRLQKARTARDALHNRYRNDSFSHGFESGGAWYSRRGKYKRIITDPAWLCDKYQDLLFCRERLAMCMSMNYEPKEDFVRARKIGTWSRQALNSFPEVVRAVNAFETLYQAKSDQLSMNAEIALIAITEVQPTFRALYRFREGTLNACEFRKCDEEKPQAGEEIGEMIVDDLGDHDNTSDSVWTMADEVGSIVEKLRRYAHGSANTTVLYAHAPPSAPGKGLHYITTCVVDGRSTGSPEYLRGNCEDWRADVQQWGRSEQALWMAIESGDPNKVKAACLLPKLQIHMRNPFSGGEWFIEKAETMLVAEALRSCPGFEGPPVALDDVPVSFRPYVVQRLWMRTVAQAHLAFQEHHRELKASVGTSRDPTVAKAFSLHYQTTVSFSATLDLNYVDFCKSTEAPLAVEHGRTWNGKLVHEYSLDKQNYVLTMQNSPEANLPSTKYQFVLPDGSVKFFAEFGKGIVNDDFDLTDLQKLYELHMASPAVMAAFLAAFGLSPLLEKLSPLVSRTITGDIAREADSEEGLSLASLEDHIARKWEIQKNATAASTFNSWFSQLSAKIFEFAHSGMTCNLGFEALGTFLLRHFVSHDLATVGQMIGTIGAAKAKDLYESAPVYAGAWFSGRMDMLVSHTSTACHKMLRPQIKAYFRAGFNAPFVSGAYTAALYIRLSLPLTPKNLVLPNKDGELKLKRWCGVLGNPNTKREHACTEVRRVFDQLDTDQNLYLSREELTAGFDSAETVEALLGDADEIDWKGFYQHFNLKRKDCAVAEESVKDRIAAINKGT